MLRSIFILLLAVHGLCAEALFVELTVVDATCGNATGSIIAAVSGGTAPYTYTWSPAPPVGQGTYRCSGLVPGTYDVLVTDGLGATGSASGTVGMRADLDAGTALLNSSYTPSCPYTCSGQLWLYDALLGGQAPYTTTFDPPCQWNTICGDGPVQVTVTDALGCTGQAVGDFWKLDVAEMIGSRAFGTCGAAPDSVEYYFDGGLSFGGVWTNAGSSLITQPGHVNGDAYTIVDPAQIGGVVTYTVPMPAPCYQLAYAFSYPPVITDCANVNGQLYVDVNGDCVFNSGDHPLHHEVVNVSPGGYSAMTDVQGRYTLALPYGTYDLTASVAGMVQSCGPAVPVNFTVDAVTPTNTIDLAFAPAGDPDVSISCAIQQAVPGFPQVCDFVLTNNSAVPTGPLTVVLQHDTVLGQHWHGAWCFAGPGIMPGNLYAYGTATSTSEVTWNATNGLDPLQQVVLRVLLDVPPDPTLIGAALDYTATVTPSFNDPDLSNNTCTHTEVVIGSFDPNDKQARTSSGSSTSWSLQADSTILYTVRFQNTGTAPAHNVVVSDTLSARLDLSTLRVVGASHAYTTSLGADRVLRFHFTQIMLPDSGSNGPGSQGFAQFVIRPVQALQEGETITNAADIFFDANPPVRTNTSALFVEFSTSVGDVAGPSPWIAPVPVHDRLRIYDAVGRDGPIEVFTMQGRCVRRAPVTADGVDISMLPTGVYVLRWSSADGTRRQARFVKE